MGVLMKMSSSIYLLLLFVTSSAVSAPPYDLTDFDALDKKKTASKPRTVDLKDITFVDDHSDFKDNLNPSTPRTKISIDGRSLPNRKGRPLYRFKRNEPVTILKDSKDGFWVAVESTGLKKQKTWLPKSAVIMPEKITDPDNMESPEIPDDTLSSEPSEASSGATPEVAPEDEATLDE